ncbi:hypothetical protein [Dapis sp. BLCC M172]|uniref:hypothetical protein n=1 Tax=Dapis sp. BLCC M172 TaxID=2975281 RepID=UPI003CEC5494
MARLSTKLVRLKRQLAVAERKEAYKQQALAERITQRETTDYVGKGAQTTYYVPSIKDSELYIQVSVPTSSLTALLGGTDQPALDKIGGVLALPAGKSEVRQRGYSDNYCRIRAVFKANKATAKLTPWGTRTLDYTREVDGQSHRELPIGGDDFRAINILWNALPANIQNKPLDLYLVGPGGTTIEKRELK